MELRNYGDEVFQADYLQKKRNRRGKVEFLVKWKGYSTKQSTWEPADNILDPLLIAEFESKREEWRKKQRLLRKKRKQRLASAEQLSDANDSEHDEVLPFRHTKRRGQGQENLWPYLPSDRLPLLWGTPPRAPRPRKARQKSVDGRKRKLEDVNMMEKTEEETTDGLSVIYESGKRRRKNEKVVEEEEEEDEEEEEEEEDDDDEEEDEDDEEDDEKWSTECWEVKYSPTLSSSPGEANVLRVHRVRNDVDYVEREVSPLSDTTSGLKGVKPTNDNNNSSVINNNSISADTKNVGYSPRNPTDTYHHYSVNRTPTASSHTTCTVTNNKESTSSSTATSSTEGSQGKLNLEPHLLSPDSSATESLTHRSASHNASHDDTAKQENIKEEEDDWNFSSQFENQVMKERERMEAQILKESHDLNEIVDLSTRKSSTEDQENCGTSLWSYPRSYSYSNSEQYQHKKLHHARRRYTLDTSREGHKITVTNVKCHQLKVTFVESDSDRGFFKHSTNERTG